MKRVHNIVGEEVGKPRPPVYLEKIPARLRRRRRGWFEAFTFSIVVMALLGAGVTILVIGFP